MVPEGDSNLALQATYLLGLSSVWFSIYSQIYSLFTTPLTFERVGVGQNQTTGLAGWLRRTVTSEQLWSIEQLREAERIFSQNEKSPALGRAPCTKGFRRLHRRKRSQDLVNTWFLIQATNHCIVLVQILWLASRAHLLVLKAHCASGYCRSIRIR